MATVGKNLQVSAICGWEFTDITGACDFVQGSQLLVVLLELLVDDSLEDQLECRLLLSIARRRRVVCGELNVDIELDICQSLDAVDQEESSEEDREHNWSNRQHDVGEALADYLAIEEFVCMHQESQK